jgi:asparagine synthase (glutamine-hydrolysing)
VHEELNKTAAAFGIEARHPFWDRRVVEFCLAVPAEQKLHEGWPRWILRRAMTGFLPDAVQWRVGKSHLGPNFQRSLLDFECERLEQLLMNDLDRIEEYVNVPTLHEAYRRRDADAIWSVVILSLWLRQTSLAAGASNCEDLA